MEIPESHRRFTIFGIDPGVSNCGISIITFERYKIVDVNVFTIHTSGKDKERLLPSTIHEERYLKICYINEKLLEALVKYSPIVIGFERPFYNPKTITAFRSLTEVMGYLRNTIETHNPYCKIIYFAPQDVKETVGVGGTKDKVLIKQKLEAIDVMKPFLFPTEEMEGEEIDEHGYDAIAVGLSVVKKFFSEEYAKENNL